MTADGEVVCLIKPQFEAGREKVGKKGVVRDPKVHEEVIHKVIDYAAEIGLESRKLEFSADQRTGREYRISSASEKEGRTGIGAAV